MIITISYILFIVLKKINYFSDLFYFLLQWLKLNKYIKNVVKK